MSVSSVFILNQYFNIYFVINGTPLVIEFNLGEPSTLLFRDKNLTTESEIEPYPPDIMHLPDCVVHLTFLMAIQ